MQIRQQSSHFMRGFQQLIQKEWIDMFNEHELQVLGSTSQRYYNYIYQYMLEFHGTIIFSSYLAFEC